MSPTTEAAGSYSRELLKLSGEVIGGGKNGVNNDDVSTNDAELA